MVYDILRGAIGVISMLALCYLLSSDRKNINWKLVAGGMTLQLILALAILKVDFIYQFFDIIAGGFVSLLGYTDAGAAFVFGSWPDDGWIQSNVYNEEQGEMVKVPFKVGFVFAFKVLPTIIFFAAFSSILYYLGILQIVIYGLAKVISKFMDLSGAESLAAAANVFIGQTEAPLIVKPYLENMTKSEIMCLMTGGMATIAGGVFALFISLLGDEYAIHFLTASIISAPAAIVAAKMLYPEAKDTEIDRVIKIPKDKLGNNLLDAISIGTTDGVKLAVNVGAMLLVFIALIAFLNGLLGFIGNGVGLNSIIDSATSGAYTSLSLEYLLGMLFAPIAWLLGVPSGDLMQVGQLLGTKTVINEVVAYVDLSSLQQSSATALSPKSVIIATYALCGFANFSSIGIQIGGISAIAPGQRSTLTEFGIKALIGGTVASFITAAIAGAII